MRRAGGRTPEIVLGVQGTRVPSCADLQAIPGIVINVVIVNHQPAVGRSAAEITDPDSTGQPIADRIARNAEAYDAAADHNLGSEGAGNEISCERAGAAQIECKIGISIVRKSVIRNNDVGLGPILSRSKLYTDIVVRCKRVVVYQHVGQGSTGHELVRIDRSAADRTRIVIVAEKIPLDHRLVRRTIVCKRQSCNIVLNDVVSDLRAGRARTQDDAEAELVCIRSALDRKAVDYDVIGCNIERR